MALRWEARAMAVLLLAQLPGASSWAVGDTATVDVTSADPKTLRWSLGRNTSATDGLKGGITWALDPNLCDSLMLLFPEEVASRGGVWDLIMPQLVTCDQLKETIRNVMRSWESANQNIHFFEVTSMCDAGAWVGLPEPEEGATGWPPNSPPTPLPPRPPPPNMPGFESDNANFGGAATWCDAASISCVSCAHAELIISGFRGAKLGDGRIPADAGAAAATRTDVTGRARSKVRLQPSSDPPLTPTSDYPAGSWLYGDSSTGVWLDGFAPTAPASGRAIRSAAIELDVSDDVCYWHADDLCAAMYFWQSTSTVDVNAALVSATLILFIVGIVLFVFVVLNRLYKIFQLTALAWDTDGDGVVEFHEVRAAIKILLQPKSVRERNGEERKVEWKAALYGLLWSMLHVNIIQAFVLCVFTLYPNSIRTAMIAPCSECADFHSVVLRQVGMSLGLQAYARPSPPEDGWPEYDKPPPIDMPQAPASPFAPPTPSSPPPSPPDADPSPSPPPMIFTSSTRLGYKCSHPTANVRLFDRALGPEPPHSVMGAAAPAALVNTWPRMLCPTDDDAAGLRYLYPECDEMLPCELDTGGNSTGCERFEPPLIGYSIWDYYDPYFKGNLSNWTALSFTPLPYGRAIAPASCVSEFKPSWGKTGFVRALLLFFRAVIPPILFVYLAKLICILCLRLPMMAETRKRNAKLQRMAAKRKAEVRRMLEGGQEFAVKRQAKATGKTDIVDDVARTIRANTVLDAKSATKVQAGTALLQRMKTQKIQRTSTSADDPSPRDAAGVGVSGEPPTPAAAPLKDQLAALSKREAGQ